MIVVSACIRTHLVEVYANSANLVTLTNSQDNTLAQNVKLDCLNQSLEARHAAFVIRASFPHWDKVFVAAAMSVPLLIRTGLSNAQHVLEVATRELSVWRNARNVPLASFKAQKTRVRVSIVHPAILLPTAVEVSVTIASKDALQP